MENHQNSLVCVVEQSNTIRRVLDLYLREDCEVETFEDYQSFNDYIANLKPTFPYIVMVDVHNIDQITRWNNTVILLTNDLQNHSHPTHLVVKKPFSRDGVKAIVNSETIKREQIRLIKEKLESELSHKDGDDIHEKRTKV